MANIQSKSSESIKDTHEALRKAVKAALERKRKLGQYSVTWQDNEIIIQGEDAPKTIINQIK